MIGKTIHKGDNCGFNFSKKIKSEPVVPADETRKHIKKQTIFFKNYPKILCGSSVVSEKESNGPIGKYFDIVIKDPKAGKKKFEEAEIEIAKQSINRAIEKAKLGINDIDIIISGDLLNQITTSSYVARDFGMTYLGLYSACSTMTESLAIGASLIDAGHFSNALCATVSHFATAERQFRSPLEYGSQRPPYAQWTVTGAGATVLTKDGDGPRIVSATFGKVIDFGTTDLSNMGAAMAPAAADTLINLFRDTNTTVDDYDLILTGDLGKLGSDILRDLMNEQGYSLGQNYKDCGAIIYDVTQNCYQGGSGCGCSAAVFNSYILEKINDGTYNRVAFLATGALMSTQSCYQGETIPCISHAVVIER